MREYSIKDVKAQEFGPLFQAKNDDVAKRSFTQYMTGERVLYIDDYELYCIADFDVETGEVEPDFRLVYAPKSEVTKENEESYEKYDWNVFKSLMKKGRKAEKGSEK